MNARTNTAATPEIRVAPQNLILVPLSQLRPSKLNVRKTVGASITELAASVARVGLLQNLTVILASNGEHYEVVAGSRRLAALKLLVKKRRIARDYEVPCLLVADASARIASLTENEQRLGLHPADQFEAFAALVADGRPIEDIAAYFGVTPASGAAPFEAGNCVAAPDVGLSGRCREPRPIDGPRHHRRPCRAGSRLSTMRRNGSAARPCFASA